MENILIKDFLQDLGDKKPIPSGGGACSLVGAVSTSLGLMLGNFTLGKEKYMDVEEQVFNIVKKLEEIRETFLNLMKEDEEAFLSLSKIYKIKPSNKEEGEEKESLLQKAYYKASMPPLKIMREARNSLLLIKELSLIGNSMLLSDGVTSAFLMESVLQGAYVNFLVNVNLIKNKGATEEIEKEAESYLELLGTGNELLEYFREKR